MAAARRWLRWGLVGLGILVLLPVLAVAVLVGRVWLGQPDLDGDRAVAGLAAETTISRDEMGVVHIRAESETDAFFALGYAHAQDRFFQMEMLRRLAAGRLAELVGPSVAKFDRRMRTLGFARLAKTDVAVLSPDARAVFEAYADGVNAWLETRSGVAADELALLLAPEPEPWRVEHSLAWHRLMSLRLTVNWESELKRLQLAEVLTPKQLADLWPDYPADAPISTPDVSPEALQAAAKYAALANKDDGSNGWVVSAALSKTGAPLLANDPHLGLTNPSVWHLARIEAPGLVLAGATAPGVPSVILGHNGHIAWGLTNATTDASDVFIETVDPADATRYLTPEGAKPFEVLPQRISVRFGDDIAFDARATRHGPVISDERDLAPEGAALALSHTGLMPQEGAAETLHRLNRARNMGDIRAAAGAVRSPQQNLFYAGPDGIALATVAALPVRRSGDGYMPAQGSAGKHDWAALAGSDAMPSTINPARGWAANANNRIAGDDYPLWLGREWGHPGRISRVEELLRDRGPFGPEDLAAMQMDDLSPVARDLLPTMLDLLDRDALSASQAALAERLARWDYRTPVDAAEPLIFFSWASAAVIRVFRDEMGEAFDGWHSLRAEPLGHVLKSRQVWCDQAETDAKETCGQTLANALADAEAWLTERYGDDPAAWRWGEAHEARFRHMAFGFIPGLNKLFDIRIPSPGAYETINRAAFRVSNANDPFAQAHGPTLRAVYDLANLDRSRFVIGPGQSGRLFSPNRSDMAELWRDGGHVTLAPLADPAHVLRLKPAAE